MTTEDLPSVHETAVELVQAPGAQEIETLYGVQDALALRSLQDAKARIRGFQRKGLELIIAIGAELVQVQQVIGERVYEWASVEVGIGKSSVHNYMAVAQRFKDPSKIPTVGMLPMRTVYALATHMVPDAAIEEVISRIEAGEKPRLSEVKKVISRHRQVGESNETLAGTGASQEESNTGASQVDASVPGTEMTARKGIKPQAGFANKSEPQHLIALLTSLLKERSQDFEALESLELAMVIEALKQLMAAATKAHEKQ